MTDKVEKKASEGQELTYEWKGLNKKGRVVGTGTYIFRVNGKAISQEDGSVVPYNKEWRVGFVRGKN